MTTEQSPGWMDDKTYELVFRNTPRLCVDLLIDMQGGILMGKRAIEPFMEKWHLPGGRVRYKESLENAVSRIANEELGVGIKNARQIGIIEHLEDGPYMHSVSIVYRVGLESEALNPSHQSSEFKVFHSIPQEMHRYQEYFLKDHKILE